ncbi:MAG: hypothetical protein IPK26_15825 [Planctomycetes bacterium]|nr:hypothetical protein [Planctomycetota bacterium]
MPINRPKHRNHASLCRRPEIKAVPCWSEARASDVGPAQAVSDMQIFESESKMVDSLCRALPGSPVIGLATSGARRRGVQRILLAAVLAAIGLAGAPVAQNEAGVPPPNTQGQGTQNPASPRLVDAGDFMTFSLAENNGMELTEFIKWAQEMTGRVFTYNDTELTMGGAGGNRVTFLGTVRMKKTNFKDQFYYFFQMMLYIKGFAVVMRGEGDLEIAEIVSTSGQRQKEIGNSARYVTVDDLEQYKNQTGVTILTSLPLKHINAQVATNALRPFYGMQAGAGAAGMLTIGNVGNNTAMLLQGFGPQVYGAYQLLNIVDKPFDAPELLTHVARLENQAAEEIEPVLTEILNDRQRVRQQALAEAAAGGGGGAPVGGGQQAQIKVVVIPTQKAVVLSGTREQINEALELIARLDLKSEPQEGRADVLRLKNVLAEDLRTTLNQFLQDDQQAEVQAQQGQPGAGGQSRRPRRTVIQAHKESNSLLVSASATKYKDIVNLITQLDRRQDQVLIEAALVELTTGDLARFGVELGLLDVKENGDFTRGFGFSHFGNSAFTDQDDDGLPDTRLPDFDSPLQGLTGGIISGGDFAVPALINALATDDRANILSLPSVLVNNNEEATVTTEEERPTIENNSNANQATQSSGTPRNAGITLEISPTISPNNYLRLNINLEVSRFVGSFDPDSPTGGGVVLRRTIRTQVTMPSNDTMVIGGVIEDRESYSDGGIPFLKDLPLLGFLFRKSEETHNKTNLYFFVTPTILNEEDFQDLYHLSLRKKMEANEFIGERRLRLIDHRWSGSQKDQARMLQDPGATLDDADAQGDFEMGTFRRPDRSMGAKNVPSAPSGPTDPAGATPTGRQQ